MKAATRKTKNTAMQFLGYCAAVCLGIAVFACSGEEVPKKESIWRFFAQTEEYQFFYDTGSIESNSRGIVKVAVKRTIREEPQIINETKKGLVRELKKRQKAGMSIRGYENFEYEMIVCQIDCKSGLIRFLKSVNYDNRGNIIETVAVPDAILKWEKIVPDTINDTLRRSLCKPL
jgi:hypothetical protein